jgi:hypothetical protein
MTECSTRAPSLSQRKKPQEKECLQRHGSRRSKMDDSPEVPNQPHHR